MVIPKTIILNYIWKTTNVRSNGDINNITSLSKLELEYNSLKTAFYPRVKDLNPTNEVYSIYYNIK